MMDRLVRPLGCAVALLGLAAAPASAQVAGRYQEEAQCLGIYEAGYFIFTRLANAGGSGAAGAMIAGAVNGAAKMSYEQTIDSVLAAGDMTDEELNAFRVTHLASSDAVIAQYAAGELDLFGAGQLVYDCDVLLGYTDDLH